MTQAVVQQVTVCQPCQRIMIGEVKKTDRGLGTLHFVAVIKACIDHHHRKRDTGDQQSQAQFTPTYNAPAQLLVNTQNKGLAFGIQ